jgi:hypothetical protein
MVKFQFSQRDSAFWYPQGSGYGKEPLSFYWDIISKKKATELS